MSISPLLDQLIKALQVLPGVGPKSAQRMALSLLKNNRGGAHALADALTEAANRVGQCKRCRTFSENDVCGICADPRRDASMVCVVESPADILAIEHAGSFRGMYFVLHGRLSPIEGVGPQALGVDVLVDEVRRRSVSEVILATNPTVEGEATALLLIEALRGTGAQLSRIAHGVPIGGELEYVDGGTIVHALQGRRSIG